MAKRSISDVIHDETGATAIEYALIAFIVGVGILPALSLIAPSLNDIFGNVEDEL